MIRYVGIDLHKRLIEACFLDEGGRVVMRRRLESIHESSLLGFARAQLLPTDQVVLEATTNVWAVVAVLERFVQRVVVSNPLVNKAIAHAKIKTDKVDAQVLAHLLRLGFLAEVWQPDASCRELREWTTRRTGLVSARIALLNRIHSTLAQRLLECPHLLDTPRGRAWLNGVSLDEPTRWLVDCDLRLLDSQQHEIDAIDLLLAKKGYADPRIKLLMTLPGVSQHTAQSLLAAIGDIHRFPTADKLAAYLGLVPSTRQSSDKCHHGPITKRGRSHTRWILIQAAQAVRQHPGPLGHFFRRTKARKNHNIAVVAVARKLAMLAWHVLRSGQPYRYALPRATDHKLSRLRVQATGQKRTTGPKPGTKPGGKLPEGGRSKTVKSLDAIFAAEGIPQAAPAPPGEQRHLERLELTQFAADLHEPHVHPRTQRPRDEAGAAPSTGSTHCDHPLPISLIEMETMEPPADAKRPQRAPRSRRGTAQPPSAKET